MTVDETLCRSTESLILPSHQAFYPIKIPNLHPQLRHYISTPDPDILYFVTLSDVCSLRLSARKGDLITSLPFEPRCLAAGHGWICLGGPQGGNCAFIRLGESNEDSDVLLSSSSPAEVDALLPLDLDSPQRRNIERPLAQPPRSPTQLQQTKPEVFIHELGGEIVNSVTIFRMPGDGKNISDEDLCLLSNNDATIKIYSLSQGRVVETLDHPIAMNFAVISPSGNLLAAVGDENRIWFYKRWKLPNVSTHHDKTYAMYQWREISSPMLPKDPYPDEDHYFTIAFSPSGHLCAVASQEGIISVFDTSLVQICKDGEDALLCSFRSSRSSASGAVRSMSFSPQPWDLLVWAEDHGRVCVADVREQFRRRQTLELNVHADNIERRELSDEVDPDLEFNPGSRAARAAFDMGDDEGASPGMVGYMEIATERQRLRRQARALAQGVMREASPYGLTERERQTLNTIRTPHQRDLDTIVPYSVRYREAMANRVASQDNDNPRLQTLNTFREYIRERNRGDNSERNVHPRRRSSVVLSQGNNNSASNGSSSGSILAPTRPGATGASTLTVSPSRLLSPPENNGQGSSSTNNTDAWHTIEAALQANASSSQSDALRQRREAQSQYQQDARVRLEAERLMRTRLPRDRFHEDSFGYQWHHEPREVGTAGLGWGGGGRLLYVGTEEGILEYHVNVHDRKTFPDFTFR